MAASTQQHLTIGVDVGGTFTDLVAWDGTTLTVAKVPSTPPEFHRAVIEAVSKVRRADEPAVIVHGSTVATNALLQRRGEPVAFVTTEGFRDMLLIGRQNRPKLYALRVERPQPVTPQENWFTVRERIDARGNVVEALGDAEIARVVGEVTSRGLKHAAVCLLFSFLNPAHEQMLGRRLEAAGVTVSLSSEVMPEFREYERASTTAINASLRPTVQRYLELLANGLRTASPSPGPSGEGAGATAIFRRGGGLRIMHSGGGTLWAEDAARHAARLVLSGPAGGVIGAAHVAKLAGLRDVITYDMGGTSTDVATVLDGRPQWTTSSRIDGLPIGLPMFDIHTVGAGGGSIAYVDAGGALRVGPQSAGALPGPACYDRGGTEPTVTDANVVLGRILPASFLGGAMRLDVASAERAVDSLAARIGKSRIEAALGIVRVVEANMAHAVRAVSSRRGHDPRLFALVSFGGAGGLHACGLAEALEIPRVLVPPYCGVLSALGMIVAPPVVDVSQTVLGRGDALDGAGLAAAVDGLLRRSAHELPESQTAQVRFFADVRFAGQSHELAVPFEKPDIEMIRAGFLESYRTRYGQVPSGRAVEIVSLRVRRLGRGTDLHLPIIESARCGDEHPVKLVDSTGQPRGTRAVGRAALIGVEPQRGPLLVLDPHATTYVPHGWYGACRQDGSLLVTRDPHARPQFAEKNCESGE